MKNFESVQLYYFSAQGTTKNIIEKIAGNFGGEQQIHDLLRDPIENEIVCDENTLVVVGVPVFLGRIPSNCVPMLEKLKGRKTPAIAVVVYGNRDYNDALIELTDILDANDFHVVGAGAFVAQHSLFPSIAQGRPDAKDLDMIQEFANECAKKLDSPLMPDDKIKVKGNRPYMKAISDPLIPKGNDKCTKCGTCVSICPMKAISADEPRKTNKQLCISCTACIAACPQKARTCASPMYSIATKVFEGKCKERREAEYFL